MTIDAAFDQLKNANFYCTTTYQCLPATLVDSSSSKYQIIPTTTGTFITEGYQLSFANWSSRHDTFGFLNLPSKNTLSKEEGAYAYHIDNQALILDEKTGKSGNIYNDNYTPYQIYVHKQSLAVAWQENEKKNGYKCTDSEAISLLAQSLFVSGPIHEVDGNISFAYVTMSSLFENQSITFQFYYDYQGRFASNSAFPLAATATLSAINLTSLPLVTDYLKANTK